MSAARSIAFEIPPEDETWAPNSTTQRYSELRSRLPSPAEAVEGASRLLR
jgi:hypothetical protein